MNDDTFPSTDPYAVVRPPAPDAAMVGAELSRGARARYVAVLLAALVVTGVVAALWATEPNLPTRTHVAFGLIVTIGVLWVAVASWVLTRRHPLYAQDRVLAATAAVVATTVAGSATTVIAVLRGGTLAVVTAGMTSATMLAAALALLVQARARRADLIARRDALRAQIAATTEAGPPR